MNTEAQKLRSSWELLRRACVEFGQETVSTCVLKQVVAITLRVQFLLGPARQDHVFLWQAGVSEGSLWVHRESITPFLRPGLHRFTHRWADWRVRDALSEIIKFWGFAFAASPSPPYSLPCLSLSAVCHPGEHVTYTRERTSSGFCSQEEYDMSHLWHWTADHY